MRYRTPIMSRIACHQSYSSEMWGLKHVMRKLPVKSILDGSNCFVGEVSLNS